MRAAAAGHDGVVRLLLGWHVDAPRADVRHCAALLLAAGAGGVEGGGRLLGAEEAGLTLGGGAGEAGEP